MSECDVKECEVYTNGVIFVFFHSLLVLAAGSVMLKHSLKEAKLDVKASVIECHLNNQ